MPGMAKTGHFPEDRAWVYAAGCARSKGDPAGQNGRTGTVRRGRQYKVRDPGKGTEAREWKRMRRCG